VEAVKTAARTAKTAKTTKIAKAAKKRVAEKRVTKRKKN